MSDDLFQRLAAPFRPDQVSWRVGVSNKKKRQRELNDNNAKATKGQVLAYIDARDVMDRLDDVCGPAGWQNRYTHADKKTICEIGIITPDGEWVWKADGAGESDIEAEKGALSDSFKRAAVRWGIGRYLYHLPSPWVDLDEREQISPVERAKLEALLTRATGAQQPQPEGQRLAPPDGVATISLADRAKVLCGTMKAAKTADKLRQVWVRGEALRKELDAKDPERLVEIERLYAELFEKLTETVAA